MLLHSIGHMSPPGTASPWLRKYIFPGAYSPALSEVFPVVERAGLWVTDLEILRVHYAKTLAHWHQRFEANRADRRPCTTSASAGCGSSIWSAPK